jgi:hypothetical protein
MSLVIENTRTGSSTAFPSFISAEPELNLAATGNTLPQQCFTGTRMSLAYGHGALVDVKITPYVQRYQQVYKNWAGTLQGCVLEGGAQYLNLIDVPLPEELTVQCRKLATPLWPDQSSGVVILGYTANAAAATGFIVSSTAASATNAMRSTSFYSGEFAGVTSEVLNSATRKVLASAEGVEFEDGLENSFTTQLTKLVKDWGSAAVLKLEPMIFRPGVRPEITAQTLLCLGRIDDEVSYPIRSRVARRGLKSSSAKVRDAAAVTISSLADATAIADLVAAIKQESIPSLKQDMRDILEQLQTGH